MKGILRVKLGSVILFGNIKKKHLLLLLSSSRRMTLPATVTLVDDLFAWSYPTVAEQKVHHNDASQPPSLPKLKVTLF